MFGGTARVNGTANKRLEAHPLPELQSLRIRQAPAEGLAENGAGAAENNGTIEHAHEDGCEAKGSAADAVAALTAKVRTFTTATATGEQGCIAANSVSTCQPNACQACTLVSPRSLL